jgi:putative MATE family efflux protein
MAQARAGRPGVNIFESTRPMWQVLLLFLIPLMLSNILASASQTAASIFIGRLIGTHALGAISAVFPIIFLLVAFLLGICSGSTVLIGQAYGAGDRARVKKIAGTVLGAVLYTGIIAAIVGTIASPYILAALATPPDIIAQSDAYAKVVFWTFPIVFPYLAYTTFVRGTGNSTTPFYSLIISTLFSIGLTPFFILGWLGLPKLGIVSAAVSSGIAQTIALGWLLFRLRIMDDPLLFDREMLSDMRIDWPTLWLVVRIGVPTGIQVVMVSLAEIALISFVNHFGADATAAYGAVNQVVSYVQFPAISIGIAASIFSAQCIGAKREDKLGAVVRSAVALNYAIGFVLIGICYALAWNILGLFITSTHTLDVAHALLMITLWSYAVFGNSAVLSGCMRGSGDVLWPTAIGVFSIWGVEVPAAYLLMRHFGLDGVWMGYPIAFCTGLALQYTYYTLFWKRRTHERLV